MSSYRLFKGLCHTGKLYPFSFSILSTFSWRAIASQIPVCPAKPDMNKICWLARQEKINTMMKVHGHNSCGRVPKLAVLYLSAYFLFLELYPFTLSKVAIFSLRAIASLLYMCPAKPDIII